MKEKIVKILKKIEEENNIKILFAVENGSRNWGMESADSDYDVRFVFYRNYPEYLYLNDNLEVLIYAYDKDLKPCEVCGSLIDICGFDIYKYLKLLLQSNPTTIEWLFSDVVYMGTNKLSLREHISSKFNPEKLYHHYFSLARNNYKDFDKTEKLITYKKYLYSMRGLLNAKYVTEFDKIPPLIFTKTVEQLKNKMPQKIYDKLYEIIKIKSSGLEKDTVLRIPELDEYLENELNKKSPVFQKRNFDKKIFNDFISELLINQRIPMQ